MVARNHQFIGVNKAVEHFKTVQQQAKAGEIEKEVARRLGIMPEETNISEVNFGKTIPIKFKKK